MDITSLAIKIDVDTERGSRIGVPNLLNLLERLDIPATFYLSLGPDNTGRAIKRIFRKGFLKKIFRTKVINNYGIVTLLNGTLLPGPHIGEKHFRLLESITAKGFEVGIHAYDHQKWQDGVSDLSKEELTTEFKQALIQFEKIFKIKPITAAAPGWQVNQNTLEIYEEANLIYASDCRGIYPFYPQLGKTKYKVLQIPTTMPTIDELLGRKEFPLEKLIDHYLSILKVGKLNVITIHAELEGMKYFNWFYSLLNAFKEQRIEFVSLEKIASKGSYGYAELIQAEIDGRSGLVALQGPALLS